MLTYFLLVYYGPGVTAAMNVHIQLFPSGLLLIEDFHTAMNSILGFISRTYKKVGFGSLGFIGVRGLGFSGSPGIR